MSDRKMFRFEIPVDEARWRRQRWLRLWLVPMSVVGALDLMLVIAMLVFLPWPYAMPALAVGVFTVAINMWSAWDTVRSLPYR